MPTHIAKNGVLDSFFYWASAGVFVCFIVFFTKNNLSKCLHNKATLLIFVATNNTIIMQTDQHCDLWVEVPLYLSEFYQNFLVTGKVLATKKGALRQYFAFLPIAINDKKQKKQQNQEKTVFKKIKKEVEKTRICVKIEKNDYEKYFNGTCIDRKIVVIMNLHLTFALYSHIKCYISLMKVKCIREAIRSFIDDYNMPSADIESLRIRYYRCLEKWDKEAA